MDSCLLIADRHGLIATHALRRRVLGNAARLRRAITQNGPVERARALLRSTGSHRHTSALPVRAELAAAAPLGHADLPAGAGNTVALASPNLQYLEHERVVLVLDLAFSVGIRLVRLRPQMRHLGRFGLRVINSTLHREQCVQVMLVAVVLSIEPK